MSVAGWNDCQWAMHDYYISSMNGDYDWHVYAYYWHKHYN